MIGAAAVIIHCGWCPPSGRVPQDHVQSRARTMDDRRLRASSGSTRQIEVLCTNGLLLRHLPEAIYAVKERPQIYETGF
jgi:hypothetical protein